MFIIIIIIIYRPDASPIASENCQSTDRVLTTLQNLEISGNLLILEN